MSDTEATETPQAPEGAQWFVSLDYSYRPSSGPIIITMTDDGRYLTSYEEAKALGETLLTGAQYTAERSKVTIGWQLPLRHPDGEF